MEHYCVERTKNHQKEPKKQGANEIKATGRKKETSNKYSYVMRNHRHKGRKEDKERSKEQIKDKVQDKKERTKKINNVVDIKWRLVVSR